MKLLKTALPRIFAAVTSVLLHTTPSCAQQRAALEKPKIDDFALVLKNLDASVLAKVTEDITKAIAKLQTVDAASVENPIDAPEWGGGWEGHEEGHDYGGWEGHEEGHDHGEWGHGEWAHSSKSSKPAKSSKTWHCEWKDAAWDGEADADSGGWESWEAPPVEWSNNSGSKSSKGGSKAGKGAKSTYIHPTAPTNPTNPTTPAAATCSPACNGIDLLCDNFPISDPTGLRCGCVDDNDCREDSECCLGGSCTNTQFGIGVNKCYQCKENSDCDTDNDEMCCLPENDCDENVEDFTCVSSG